MKFFNKKPVIQYASRVDYAPNVLVPARSLIPKWYKDTPKWSGNGIPKIYPRSTNTFKICVPFLDGLMSGYFLVTPADIIVEQVVVEPGLNQARFTWPVNEDLVSVRDLESNYGLPIPEGHSNISYAWNLTTSFKLPKNYSALLIHPLNRSDLPFTTLSAVVDGGMAIDPSGNVPFFIRDGFEGVIPQGTPFLQIIPFKTENWNSKVNPELITEGNLNKRKSASVISGWYKRTHWRKKQYL